MPPQSGPVLTTGGSNSRFQQLWSLNSTENIKLGERLGQGVYGEVFEATLEGPGWPPALLGVDLVAKVFKDDVERVRMRAATRAQIYEEFMVGALQHPSLVTCLAFTRMSPFVALFERCNMGSLQDALRDTRGSEGGALADRIRQNSVILIVQLLEGVSFLHKNHITHNDLHTGNVLLHKTADKLELRVADFGYWSNAREGRFAEVVPIRKREVFTARHPHVAPELLSGGQYSKASDIWAVGFVMKELLGLDRWTCFPIPGIYKVALSNRALSAITSCSNTRLKPGERPSVDELLEIFKLEL